MAASDATVPPGSKTRRRILDAARTEIIAHGAAGARMDRIATLARTSKERIYFYFKDKADLVEAVAAEHSARFQNLIRFDAENIADFVGALFDFYCSHPDEVRLWLRLLLDVGEDELAADDPRVTWLQERLRSVRLAQTRGTIDPAWDPVMLLNLLTSMAASWVLAPLYVHQLSDFGFDERSLTRHRAAILEIAGRLVSKAPAAA